MPQAAVLLTPAARGLLRRRAGRQQVLRVLGVQAAAVAVLLTGWE